MPNKEKQSMNKFINRAVIIFLITVLFVIIVLFTMFRITFVKASHYRKIIDSVATFDVNYKPERGDIFDADGNILAATIVAYDVYFDLNTPKLTDSLFNANKDSLAICLEKFNGTHTAKEYVKIFESVRLNPKERIVIIARNINPFQLAELKTFPIFREKNSLKSGLVKKPIFRRELPYGNLLKRTIGGVKEEKNVVGLFGESGLEGKYEDELSGSIYKVKMRKIGGITKPISEYSDKINEKGYDLVTAIDINLQNFAHNTLKEQLIKLNGQEATLVVMETETGYIKSIVNLYNKGDSTVSVKSNYAAGYSMAPGSTFKLPIIIAAMEDGYITPDDMINTAPGHVNIYGEDINDYRNMGNISVHQVLAYSSNVGIAKIADKYYSKDKDALLRRLYDMGLGNKTGIDVMGEKKASLLDRNSDGKYNKFTFISMAYGYGIAVTPINTLTFYNAVANNGYRVKPHIVTAFKKHGKIVKEFKNYETETEKICSDKTLKAVRAALTDVVEDPYGTAHRIKSSRYKIAGKTGTARTYSQQKLKFEKIYRSSFVGYFPAEKPKYSMIVVLYGLQGEQYSGGVAAAPVFRKVADYIFDHDAQFGNIEKLPKVDYIDAPYSKSGNRHDIDKVLLDLGIAFSVNKNYKGNWIRTQKDQYMVKYKGLNASKNKVPSVLDFSAKDAVFLLESFGLNVELSGFGSVREQSIAPGTPIGKNMTVKLTLR